MSPAWRGGPSELRLISRPTLLLLLLLLLLCPHASLGDCKLPPEVPNAHPTLGGLTSFPEKSMVTYSCNEGFIKIPGKPDTVMCLAGNEWSEITVFCNRSCNSPTRLRFAKPKDVYISQNYFPVGSVVEYDCRMGYTRNHSLSGSITCLQNLSWSKTDEFCTRKSCPNPVQIMNGYISITSDILFGSNITFSCNSGYELVGVSITYCMVVGKEVKWRDPWPTCREISSISDTTIQKPPTVDVSDTKVTSTPQKVTKVDVSGTKAPLTSQKATKVDVQSTKAQSTFQKATKVDVPGTKAPVTPQKLTTVNIATIGATATFQKPITIIAPATEVPSTSQELTTVNSPAIEAPLTPQEPITVNIPATETTTSPQKPTIINSSATNTLLISQKSTLHVPTISQKSTLTISIMEAPSMPQIPATTNDSATIAKTSPVSDALSPETPSATQTSIMANSSSTQATPQTQRFTTAKTSFTQSLPVTQKFTSVHVPVTKGLHTTHRLTSAHISATQGPAVPRTTKPSHARDTPKGKGTPSSGDVNSAYGHTCIILTVLLMTLVVIGYLT